MELSPEPTFAGQVIGTIREVKPAAEVLQDLVREAEEALRAAQSFVRAATPPRRV